MGQLVKVVPKFDPLVLRGDGFEDFGGQCGAIDPEGMEGMAVVVVGSGSVVIRTDAQARHLSFRWMAPALVVTAWRPLTQRGMVPSA